MRGDRVGVGHIGTVHGGARGSGDTADGDDGNRACGHRKHGIVNRYWKHKLSSVDQQGGEKVDACAVVRVWFWTCGFNGSGAVRTDGIRWDRVGVGDIGAMQVGAWISGYTECGDDSRRVASQRNHNILDEHWHGERNEGIQQGGDRVGISDGTRGWFWKCDFHDDGAVRTDGMRGDRVGVGDIGAVHGGAWVSGYETCVVDGRTEIWEHERGMVDGPWLGQRDASGEQCRDGIGASDRSWLESWTSGV